MTSLNDGIERRTPRDAAISREECSEDYDQRALDAINRVLAILAPKDRGTDTGIRVVENRCAHRGAMVCREKRGNAASHTCVYHQWAYDAQGNLALPVMDYTSEPPPKIVADYEKIMPSFDEALCPLPPMAITHGLQLYWQQRAWPEDFGQVRSLLPAGLVLLSPWTDMSSSGKSMGSRAERDRRKPGAGVGANRDTAKVGIRRVCADRNAFGKATVRCTADGDPARSSV